jgi:hypothetical protein
MAEDLVRSFEKIDIKSYMPELPEIVKEAYGQGMDLQGMLKQMGGMINDQSGNGTDMAGVDAAAGMGGVPEIMSRPPEGGDGVLNRSM